MKKFLLFCLILITFNGCVGPFKPEKVDTRETPINAMDRARKNIEEGKGVSLKGLVGGRLGSTNYEFSTSNPMWRASLEVLDFLPLATVDYSGGVIISDWYSDNDPNEALKITVRFLDNQVRSENLKIIIHKKICKTENNCNVSLLKQNKISEELLSTIIRKAAILEKDSKNKKKKKR